MLPRKAKSLRKAQPSRASNNRERAKKKNNQPGNSTVV